MKGFVIGPIGKTSSEVRRRADNLYKFVLQESVKEVNEDMDASLEITRADLIDQAGSITTQIVQSIFDADFIIADLYEKNSNVYYELAIAHMMKKPTIIVAETSSDISFDIGTQRAVIFNILMLDEVEKAKSKIIEQLKNIVESPEHEYNDNPIASTKERRELLDQIEDTEDEKQKELLGYIQELQDENSRFRSEMKNIKKELKNVNINSPSTFRLSSDHFSNPIFRSQVGGIDTLDNPSFGQCNYDNCENNPTKLDNEGNLVCYIHFIRSK